MSLSDCFVAPQFLSSISFLILGAIFCFMESRFDIMLALGSRVAPRNVALSVVSILFPANSEF